MKIMLLFLGEMCCDKPFDTWPVWILIRMLYDEGVELDDTDAGGDDCVHSNSSMSEVHVCCLSYQQQEYCDLWPSLECADVHLCVSPTTSPLYTCVHDICILMFSWILSDTGVWWHTAKWPDLYNFTVCRCFLFADMPWYQRKIASALFASPPTSTYEEVRVKLVLSVLLLWNPNENLRSHFHSYETSLFDSCLSWCKCV